MQAALGLAQTNRLESFAARRRENFARLQAAMQPLEEHVVLPRSLPGAEPSWFGYPITLREGGAVERRELQLHLLERRIDSRLLLAGNMTLQPGFQGLDHRVAGPLEASDRVTEATLWVGCHQGLGPQMIEWIADCVTNWLEAR
jgi:CDP-6-deoxy-D-xylo-4-hexulose-3-dehydrase